MATYAIGDVQGCYQGLIRLLDIINFDSINDRLWFVGDIINRGPNSLAVLNLLMDIHESAIVVLGNHDLHLLAVAEGVTIQKKSDTLQSILSSPKKHKIIDWIRKKPLMYYEKDLNFCIVHAGLLPHWDIQQALEYTAEVAHVLAGENYLKFLKVIYGNTPNVWHPNLKGHDRLRFIVNCCTRMRYLNDRQALNFSEKRPPGQQKSHLTPWFASKERKNLTQKIIFGHWSTVHLGTIKDFAPYNVYPIDTGYVWGLRLTALRLEDEKLFSVAAV